MAEAEVDVHVVVFAQLETASHKMKLMAANRR